MECFIWIHLSYSAIDSYKAGRASILITMGETRGKVNMGERNIQPLRGYGDFYFSPPVTSGY